MITRIPNEPPKIAPIADYVGKRPKWSVMIPTYNCLPYLKKTLESVLSQNVGEDEMQIEVIDDCSKDGDYEALIAEVGNGRIGFYRQEDNMGSLRNFETCINRARGYFVHILHGDDMIKPGYYKEIDSLFKKFPDAGAAFTDYIYMDENSKELFANKKLSVERGVVDNWLTIIAQTNRIQPPAIVVKRSVYENLGSFFGVHYGEDWEMWARIAAKYPFAYTPEILASYRRLPNSISGLGKRSGDNIHKIRWVIDRIQDYLPMDERERSRKAAFRWYSRYMMSSAFSVWAKTKDRSTALALMKGAHSLRSDLYIHGRSMLLLLRLLLGF